MRAGAPSWHREAFAVARRLRAVEELEALDVEGVMRRVGGALAGDLRVEVRDALARVRAGRGRHALEAALARATRLPIQPIEGSDGLAVFLAVAAELQACQPGRSVPLPVSPVGGAIGRDRKTVAAYRRAGERLGALKLAEPAIPTRRAARYTVDVELVARLVRPRPEPIDPEPAESTPRARPRRRRKSPPPPTPMATDWRWCKLPGFVSDGRRFLRVVDTPEGPDEITAAEAAALVNDAPPEEP